MKTKVICLTWLLAALVCIPANASVIMTLEQLGPHVVATGAGTVDLASLTFGGGGSLGPVVDPSQAVLVEGSGGYNLYFGISGPTSFGTGALTRASTATGNPLGFNGVLRAIFVPQGYRSGAPLSSTTTWDNTTLTNLGVTTGIYTYTWGSGPDADSLTLYAGVPAPTSTPEPASLALLGAGLSALALLTRRKKMKTKTAFLTCLLAALFCIPAAHASVIMTLEQVGPNVVATGTGTVDLTSLSLAGTNNLGPFVFPGPAVLLEGNGGFYDVYGHISGPSTFGSGGETFASTGTGNPLAIDGFGGGIAVPHGYLSGTLLSSTATWDNTTLPTLGVTDGIYTWTWGSGANADSLTLYAGVPAPTSVPEPASALELILGAAALALFLSRARRHPLRPTRP